MIILMGKCVSLTFSLCAIISVIPLVTSTPVNLTSQNKDLGEAANPERNRSTLHITKYFDVHIDGLTDLPYSQLKDVFYTREKHLEEDENQVKLSMETESKTQITLGELKSELDEIKKIKIHELKYYEAILEAQKEITRLYEKSLQKSDGDLYLTKVGVSKTVITDSLIKIETKEDREKKETIPRDCLDVLENGDNVSGIYQIQPDKKQKPFMVLCDMDIRGGGWTHIHKRFDGSIDFFLGWREYKIGFGDLLGEFWIGLEHIRWLTSTTRTELLVEIIDRDNVTRYAHYDAFGIGPEPNGYPLNVLSGYSGDAGDSLNYQLGSKFTTKDFDQDSRDGNCAVLYSGAWWYYNCHESNLNGKFINIELNSVYANEGLHWKTFRSLEYSHAAARMLVKPAKS